MNKSAAFIEICKNTVDDSNWIRIDLSILYIYLLDNYIIEQEYDYCLCEHEYVNKIVIPVKLYQNKKIVAKGFVCSFNCMLNTLIQLKSQLNGYYFYSLNIIYKIMPELFNI